MNRHASSMKNPKRRKEKNGEEKRKKGKALMEETDADL